MTSEKRRILDNAGYFYFETRLLYANRKTRKVFSLDFIQGNTIEELKKRILEGTEGTAWALNLESRLTDSEKRELELFLEQGRERVN